MSFKILAQAHSRITGHSNAPVLWFKSKSIKAIGPFALQLETKSDGEVKSGDPIIWFKISVFVNKAEPAIKTWFSHTNESVSTSQTDVWHFGPIFYPDHELIRDLKVGNIIGVEVVSGSSGKWSLQVQGKLVVKPLANLLPLTEHLTWSLRDSPEEGLYTISTNNECVTAAHSSEFVSNLWFKTPPLPADIITRLSSVKLYTNARHQGYITDKSQGTWSWFDIVAFGDEDERVTPLADNGGPMVTLSHKLAADVNREQRQEGKLLTRGNDSDFVSRLKPGNVIGVRVCAQYYGWENHAVDGRLLISLSERKTPPLQPNEAKLNDFTTQLLQMVMSYDKDILKGVLQELEVGVLSKDGKDQ